MGSIFRESRRHGEQQDGVEAMPPPQRRLLLLRHCLAIQLQKRRKGAYAPGGEGVSPPSKVSTPVPPAILTNETSEFWMYDSGYLLFQSFLEANLKCFWNPALREAVRGLEFRGYVHPGVLLVASPSAGDACLDRIRNAWSRNVLKPPADHSIAGIGDVEELAMVPVCRGSFTPLPEALCWVVLELTSAGEAASLSAVRSALGIHFPGIKSPSESVIYDALAALMVDGKVYQTANGYFVVTPESKRRSAVGMVMPECVSPQPVPSPIRSQHHQSRRSGGSHHHRSSNPPSSAASTVSSASRLPHSCPETNLNGPTPTQSSRHMLMSMDEAMTKVHGEMETVREGHITHQAVQTNLADVICGGNANDKILYGRSKPITGGRWCGSLGRRRSNSLRLFGSKRHAISASSLVGNRTSSPSPPSPPGPTRHRRSASLRLYPSSCASSSLSYSSSSSSSSSASPSPLCPTDGQQTNKKGSLLSRLFRRGGSLSWRHKRTSDGNRSNTSGNSNLPTFSAQFPPLEWFNPSVAHLHSVATQTRGPEITTSSPHSSPIQARTKLARSQGSLPSLSQRTSAGDTIPPPPSSSSSIISSRASTLPRPRHRHRSGGSVPLQGASNKGSRQPASEVNTSIPNSSPSITSSSRRSLASTISPPSFSPPSTAATPSRSTRHAGGWAPKGSGTGTSISSKNTTPASSMSGGSSNGSREADKMQVTSKLVSPSPGGKGSILTLQVSSRSSPGSNYSLSVNGGGSSTIPSSAPLPCFNSHFGTTTTTTMTTSATVSSAGEPRVNGVDGGIKSRTEVSVEARQIGSHGAPSTRVTTSPVKSVVRVEGEGRHLVVLNNVGGVTKTTEKIINRNPPPPPVAPITKTDEVKDKPPVLATIIPTNGLDKMRHDATDEEKRRSEGDRLTVAKINGEELTNGNKSPSEDSIVGGGSSDTSVGTGPFENGLTLMEFKSLAAQRILKGLSANSIDTLVEVNMAAAARKTDGSDVLMPQGTNYDVTVHTDFGMV